MSSAPVIPVPERVESLIMTDQPLTLPALARAAGVTEKQLRGAVEAGEVKPVAVAGRAFLFTPDQVAELRKAAKLVAWGIGLATAVRIVRGNPGWTPRPPMAGLVA
jgi:hypothetical protein